MTDRLREALESLVLSCVPELKYLGVWDYNVVSVSSGPPVTVDATTTDPTLPDISGVPIRPGPDGGYAVPSPGDVVAVGFANPFNPVLRRPYVVALDPTSVPSLASLGGGGPALARVGDHITISSAQILAATMVAGSTPVTVSTSLQGTISSGSSRVGCGP